MVDQSKVALITGGDGDLARCLGSCFRTQGWTTQQPSRALLDVRNIASIQAYISPQPRLDALLCNAGLIDDNLLLKLSSSAWEEVITTNLRGAFACAQAAYPLLQAHGGQIIFIGSYVGIHGAAGQSNYAAAKAGLCGLSASLAQEWGADNIRCNVVLPGFLPTKMNQHLTTLQVASIRSRHALQRFNTTEEAAAFIVHLAGLNHISGQVFQLDSRISSPL